jgi:hypothetical protein
MKLQHCLAAIAAACLTTLAAAAPITYTFTATVTTNEGGGTVRDLVLAISGDTTNVDASDPNRAVIASGLSYALTIGGSAHTFNDAGLYVFNRLPDGVVGFGFTNTLDWLLLDTVGLESYTLQADAGPVGGALLDDFQSGLGLGGPTLTQLTYDSLSNVQFSAVVQDNGVPEPGSFALAGLALAGLALTARRRA